MTHLWSAAVTDACLRVLARPRQVSGMKIRFLTLIRELRKAGDDVLVITPDRNPPPSYHGAKVTPARHRRSCMSRQRLRYGSTPCLSGSRHSLAGSP